MTAYTSLQDFQAQHSVTLPCREEWRLCPPFPLGCINALEHVLHGHLAATNGILCYIIRGDNLALLCHLDWFIPLDIKATIALPRAVKEKIARPVVSVEQLMRRYGI